MTETFGELRDTGGATAGTGTTLIMGSGPFTLTEDGLVSKISVYAYYSVGGPSTAICNIYADSGGSPSGVPLGATQEVSVGTSIAWVDFPFSTPLALDAGVYWLFIGKTAGTTLTYYRFAASSQWTIKTWTYGSWPSPIGSVTLYDYVMSIYATYTPSAGGLSVPVAMHHYNRINKIIRG